VNSKAAIVGGGVVFLGVVVFILTGDEPVADAPFMEVPSQVVPGPAAGDSAGADAVPDRSTRAPALPPAGAEDDGDDDDADDEVPTPDALMQRPDPDAPPLTEAAAHEPDMREMDGGVADYDAPTEARQRFRAFELSAIAQRPLSPEKWREIQGTNGDETLSVLRRAKQLTDDGEPEAAKELMVEWQRLTALYRNEAYGRGQVLVTQ